MPARPLLALTRTHNPELEAPMPDTTTAPDRTVENPIDALHRERDEITTAEQADPIRAARDVAQWHDRDTARRRRLAEIEREIRDRQEYGALVDSPAAMRAISTYLGVARGVAQKHRYVTEHRVYSETHNEGTVKGQGGHRDIEKWWTELTKLARSLPEGDDARALIARELDAWFTLRNSWAIARVAWTDNASAVPSPEATGGRGDLPPWIGYGVRRTDRADDSPSVP